jgi:pimeloyl-ACP methyl ester carboxylesterase
MTEATREIHYDGETFSIATKFSKQSDVWIVFLHGLGCAKECFDEAFNTELGKYFSILTFDFMGFGDSDKPDDFQYTLEEHAAIATIVIEQYNPKQIIIVAHSMGGTIGTLLARRMDNIRAFIKVEGNLISEDAGIVSRRTADQNEVDFILTGLTDFLEGLKDAPDTASQAWARWYEHSSRIAIYRSCRSLVHWSDDKRLLDYFKSLPQKCFIYGDQRKDELDCTLQQLQGTPLLRISGSGHFMMLDNPREFYTTIGHYLDEIGLIPSR